MTGHPMIRLQQFQKEDAQIVQTHLYPKMTIGDVERMIADWNTCSYQDHPFEMFAIEADGRIAGCASLLGRSKTIASAGVEIFSDDRRKGIASEAVLCLCRQAAEGGYRIILDQVRTDNRASIGLHEKCGFESDGYVYRNGRGHEVLLYLKSIG